MLSHMSDFADVIRERDYELRLAIRADDERRCEALRYKLQLIDAANNAKRDL